MPKVRLRHILAVLWLVFTLSLAGWWLVFGLRQINQMRVLDHSMADRLITQQRMLMGEGSMLLLVVLLGGVGLIVLSFREEKRREEMQVFLSGFTHELKTSLASLRLQSEILIEEEPSSPRLLRLLREVVRLEIQLENSLLLARADHSNLYPEELRLSEILARLSPLWPNLEISLTHDCYLQGDRRALESIFKNIIQNSFHHGEATHINIVAATADGRVSLRFSDNGHGFTGKLNFLGRPFFRHNGQSGSGLGLYLSKRLLNKMRGDLSIPEQSQKGFLVDIVLAGRP